MGNSGKKRTFEQALAELESVVERLESGELALNDALEIYEQGMKLARDCQTMLDAAEKKILILQDAGSTDKDSDITEVDVSELLPGMNEGDET